MREYRLIDADCHVVEPPHIWDRWLPKRYHDRAPRLVKDEEGGDAPADASTEEKAQKYWTRASDAETAGDLATAKDLYTKLVALGNTSLKGKAEAKLKELDGKSGAAEKRK